MNWFKKIVINWVREDWDNARQEQDCMPSRLISTAENASINDDPVLNFKVYSAIGGKVVEFRRYDRKSDRNDSTTYIITNDQDFGERIAKIATMENIKL
jgi:hypothetical protein